MKPIEKAIRRASERRQDEKDINSCIEYLVCPACAGDLKETLSQPNWIDGAPTPPPIRSYKCDDCQFTH